MEGVPNAGLGCPLSSSQQLKSEDEQAVDDDDVTRKSEGGVVGYDDENRPVRLLPASSGSWSCGRWPFLGGGGVRGGGGAIDYVCFV